MLRLPVWEFVPILTDSGMGVFPNTNLGFGLVDEPLWGFHNMKKNIKDVTRILTAVAAMAFGQSAFAQNTQTFTVEVASALTITAPSDSSITHDGNDSNQSFGVSDWAVTCNNGSGATVDFTTTAVFENGTVERDLTMTVSVVSTDNDSGGSPVWAVNPALTTYSSDYANSDVAGNVQATSAGPGNATLGLGMVFVDNDYSLLPAGSYTVVVTGTITANP